ncbi:zinc-binding dehydrogenase [Streptomyces litchfieldiae]|uniref:Zinc-binding dehydrogenase n=1 Tax=Streptomyces litchfieldiae TaxID=3075543 RepID=A0ABU2MNY9_9ACTN|nr:zinc-binding dehydrogenase [Streptomyces sp. DSM 44938]MDT0343324.1 zinc-binding dehydrogenase [Streptomyces sp. DSM 44938]
MHAIRLHTFGPPENLRYEEVPDPEPGPGQVRIAVAAAGVHVVDTALRAGPVGGRFPTPELPTIPGREVAGTIDAVGEGVAVSWLGRRVVAHLGMVPGGYAERAVTAVANLHPLPDEVSEDQAVAMVGTGRMTMGILRFTELGPGDTVLVLAAAGGIGGLLVQYAKHRGATVIGAAGGPAKADAVRGLGADLAVDYAQEGWADRVRAAYGDRPLSHVFEGVGGELGVTAMRLLAPGGVHLTYGYVSAGIGHGEQAALPEKELAEREIVSQSVLGPPLFEKIGGPENLRVLEEESLAHVAAGTLTPLVHHFPLADAAAAHRALESRATIGKVVLIP